MALEYFQDGGVAAACPPVTAVLHLMAHGNYQGMAAEDPKLRAMFTRESTLQSTWYRERLRAKQGQFGVFLHQAHNWADWETTKRSYELYARYVMPHFSDENVPRRVRSCTGE